MVSLIFLSLFISTCFMQTITTHDVTVQSTTANKNVDRECTEPEKHFIYTPCDNDGSRWKVQVPMIPKACKITNPRPPEAGINCSQGCESGEYLDIRTQKCSPCQAGTYSRGETQFIKISKKLPEGYETYGSSESYGDTSCKEAGWTIQDGYIVSNGSSCKSVLKYQVKLAKASWISFSARSREEESASLHVWMDHAETEYYSLTRSWKEHKLNMKKGENVVYFVGLFATNLSMNNEEGAAYDSDRENAVLLKDISVKGFSYTLECKSCRAGYYSKPGSSQCSPCKANTFSKKGAVICQKCPDEQYSAPGSSKCVPRKPCLATDYHQFWEPCNHLITRSRYTWNEPHVCNERKGVKLPKDGPTKLCPPCNPGLAFNGTACVFCLNDTFNNGQSTCQRCPPNSAPAPGLFYIFWTHFPNRPMHLYCIARPDSGCETKTGWELHDSYIGSGIGHADDAELFMDIAVKNFTKPFATLKLDFEIVNCPSNNCRLKIQQIHSGHVVDDIDTFEGTTNRTQISLMKSAYSKSKFRLLFEKKSFRYPSFRYSTAELRIYSIEVSNVKEGGTKECESCSSNKEGDCVQCEPGSYINSTDNHCVKCPANTYIESSNQSPVGSSLCKPCPKGSLSLPGSATCFFDCYVTVGSGLHSKAYNLSALGGSHIVFKRFCTGKGYKFYHGYHLNICGKKNPQSFCTDDATPSKTSTIKTTICQRFLQDGKNLISAQPIAIGDDLVQIEDITQNFTRSGKTGIFYEDHSLQFHFHSNRITEVCKNGTGVFVKFFCDPTARLKIQPAFLQDC